jgi:DNA polymerase elongation subunit (family B)
LDIWYLVDAKTTAGTVVLTFCDVSGKETKEVRDSEYEPYFLIPYPPNEKDAYTIDRIIGKVTQIQKSDLFTDKMKTLAKVSVKNPENIEKFSRMFENVWENEIDFTQGYVYDHGLVYGVPYSFQGNQFNMLLDIQKEIRQEFEDTFGETKKSDPKKYAMLEYWFNLLQQPVPQVAPEIIGVKEFDTNKNYVAFMLSRIANIPVPKAYSSRHVSDLIKSIIYTYLRRNGILIPNSSELRRERELKSSVAGALTVAPKSGIYFNTVVTDFESLYPSVIDSYNLSYETVNCEHEECESNKISEIEHHVCTKRRGFYSVLVGALKDLRIRWFKPLSKNPKLSEEERRSAEAVAKLLKHLTVSSYGVTIRIHGLASTPLAESITGYGRHILKTAWKMAEDRGLHPTYGDTDSLFLDNPSEEEVEWLVKTVKEKLRLDLAVDKRYSLCVLPRAKKAYFGILPDGSPDIKGLTVIKSNSPRFFQKVFRDCVKELSQVKNMEEYEAAKKRITETALEAEKTLRQRNVSLDDLQYFVELFFDPEEKLVLDETMHQPYQCAVQLMDSGVEVNKRDAVSFIKVKPFLYKGKRFTVKPSGFVKNLVDVNVGDYIRNLRTALGQAFEPMNISFEAEKDMKLSDWFSEK